MPVPVDELTANELFPVKPESNQCKALSFLVTHHEYGFTPREIAARTALDKTTAVNALARLFENELINRADDVYYIEPHQVEEQKHRLESLDSAVRLFEATPNDDSYAEEGWEQEVPSIDPDN
ncbi:MarR family transcriptional regulator [Halorubrum tebenquichense]|uniref:HTH marR-type domain-containing protein n=1 Tax=Halorubrum tebenquichense DSM 14210 TaxID=1227485 RepID=M0DF02_9EURY|nr:helix-turn-helix domain-containing protein [Halorubrum tebenquichense]ELZ32749.1 hypothetical protein C472_15599 [Halorubrum tebenquichense DSM 14210]